MRKIIALLAFLSSSCAIGQSLFTTACIFSGSWAKCLPQNGILLQPNAGVRFPADPADATKYVGIIAPSSMSGSAYNIQLPDTSPGNGTALYFTGGTYSWQSVVSGSALTNYQNTLPMKYAAYAASTANIASLSGDPGTVDGIDFSFGGLLLLKNQTDNTENGLWSVDPLGPWSRYTTFPDNTSSALSAIVPVNTGGTVNGDTIWYSRAPGDGSIPFIQIPTTNSNTPLTSGQAVITTTGGRIASEAQLNKTRGGTGVSSTATFPTSGVVVTEAATETLTNKTLTSPILTTPTLGAATASSLVINGAGSSGTITLPKQTLTPSAGANTMLLYMSSSANKLNIQGENGFDATLSTTGLSASRVYTLPDVTDALAVKGANTFTAPQTISDTTDASSSTTGALIVSGGVGIAKKLYVGTSLNFSDTTKGIVGTGTNNDAGTGFVGEYIKQDRTFTARTAATTATTLNVTATKLTLTAGDWDISGSVTFTPQSGGTVVTTIDAGISKTSATLPAADTLSDPTSGESRIENNYPAGFSPGGSLPIALIIPTTRASISSSTDFYLVAYSAFTVGLDVNGAIWARRVR